MFSYRETASFILVLEQAIVRIENWFPKGPSRCEYGSAILEIGGTSSPIF